MSADESRQASQLNGGAKPFVPQGQAQSQGSPGYGNNPPPPHDYSYERPGQQFPPHHNRMQRYGGGGGPYYNNSQYGGGMQGVQGGYFGHGMSGEPMYQGGPPMGQHPMPPGRAPGGHHSMVPNAKMSGAAFPPGGPPGGRGGGGARGNRGMGSPPMRGGAGGGQYYDPSGPPPHGMMPMHMQPPPPQPQWQGPGPYHAQSMGGRMPPNAGGNGVYGAGRPQPHLQTASPPSGAPPYPPRGTSHTPIPAPPMQQGHHAQRQQPQQPVSQQQQQQQQQQRAPPPPPAQRPQQSLQQRQPPSQQGNTPKVILVAGYRRTGKTTVARELARERGYEYISLVPLRQSDSAERDERGDEDEVEEAEEALEEMVTFTSLEKRFAPLSALLARKAEIKGIVIDDALILNKFEPYYVEFMLRESGLRLDYLVVITTELSSLIARGVSFDSGVQRKAHPESFEFGSWLETHNAATSGATPIAVVDGECELDQVVKDSSKQLRDVEARGLPALSLPEVNFIPGCALVRDPLLVDTILAAEREAIGVKNLAYNFPYSQPNYLLEYAEFARHALLFRNYMIVPWIWGDKVSLIGYGDDVYVHLPSYKVVFRFLEAPLPLRELLVQLRAEVATARAAALEADGAEPRAVDVEEKLCVFSLEAAMLDDVIYISDMMALGAQKGSRMLLHQRVDLLNECLSGLRAPGSVRMLDYYRVKDISKCLKEYADTARGVLFKNPDGMETGEYDDRNFIYSREDVKSVKVRIWAGRFDSDDAWVFDAYASNAGEDSAIQASDKGGDMLVHILNTDVEKYSLNDGDIVECIEEQVTTTAAPTKGGKKGAKAQVVTTRLAFQKRCPWEVEPTPLYYQTSFLSKPAWPTSLFLEACKTIDYEAPVLPEK